MLTLKVAHNDWPEAKTNDDTCGPCNEIVGWFADVAQVTKLGQVAAHKAAQVLQDARFTHLSGMEIWCWTGYDDTVSRQPMTVIMVRFGDGETRTMLVERAWLLGPNGDTVERVAP